MNKAKFVLLFVLVSICASARADIILYPNQSVIYRFDWGDTDLSRDTEMIYYFDLARVGERRQTAWEGIVRLYDEIELSPGLTLTGGYGANWALRIPRLFPPAEVLFTDPVSYIEFTYIDTRPNSGCPVVFDMRAIADQQFGSISGRIFATVPAPATLPLLGVAFVFLALVRRLNPGKKSKLLGAIKVFR